MQSQAKGVTSKECRSQLAGTIWTSKELFQVFAGSTVGNAGDTGLIPGLARSQEKEMATHSSILAWKILRPEEPGGLLSIGAYSRTQLKRLSMHACMHWRRKRQPTPVLLPGKSHGRRSPVGCSPWGRYKSDTTERLHFHFSLSCIGEGNGNPLQCPCLQNPRDREAWWAAVYGVAQSQT